VSSDEPRTRIVVRKKHGGGHHGGAWKVAYADFVTTMMALFIVLWIVGQSDAVKQAIAAYFKNPGIFKEGQAPTALPSGNGVLPGERIETPPPAKAADEGEVIQEEKKLQEAAGRIKEMIEKKGGAFESLKDQIRIEVTPEGLRIEVIERDNSPLFRVGSATPIHPLKPLLEGLQGVLGTLQNHITVEGHTDARQYSDRWNYSNWELSADRANSARRVMENAGLPAGRIDRVVGFADRMLLVPEDPMHPNNRRITLLVRRQGQR
jgi:chemotaxis protein MotB